MRPGRTTVIHFSAQTAVTVAGFVATFAIAYLLGAGGLGQYAVAVALGHFWLSIPAEAVTSAIKKRMSEGESPGEYLTAGFVMVGLLGVLLAAIIYGLGAAFAAFLRPTNEFVLVLSQFNSEIALLLFGSVAFKSVLAGLVGQKKVAHQGVVKAVERVFRTSSQVVLMLLGYKVTGLILGHAFSLVITGAGGLFLYAVRPAMPGRSHFRRILSFARYSWLGSLKSRTFGWMDVIVLSFFVNSSLIGIYEAAWGLASMLGMLNASIRNTLFPELSELSTTGNVERIHHFLNEGLVFSGAFVIPGLFGAGVIGQRVLRIYGPEFDRGALVLLVLILAYGVQVYGSQFVSVLNAIDRPDVAFRTNQLFIMANIVLNVVLVWQFGWHGAAVATACSTALWTAVAYWSLSQCLGRPTVPSREIIEEVVASVAMAGVVLIAVPFAPKNRFGTVVLVFFGAGIYIIVLLMISSRIRRKIQSLLPEPARPLLP